MIKSIVKSPRWWLRQSTSLQGRHLNHVPLPSLATRVSTIRYGGTIGLTSILQVRTQMVTPRGYHASRLGIALLFLGYLLPISFSKMSFISSRDRSEV